MATADARAESAEQTSRMDLVSRDLRALTKSYHKLRTELADFQARVSFDRQELGSDNGKEFRSFFWFGFLLFFYELNRFLEFILLLLAFI